MPKKKLSQHYIDQEDEANQQRWLWYRRIPLGLVTLLSGEGGVGKTNTLANIFTTVFEQEEFPDGTFPGTDKGHVVFLTTENDSAMLGKNFGAQGFDFEAHRPFIHLVNFVIEEGSNQEYVFDIDRDLPMLEQVLDEWHPIALVIDPLREFHSRRDNDSLQVRSLMMVLNQVARKHQLALIGVIHWNKDEDKGRSSRMAGSHQYRDSVRSVIIIEEDRKDKKLKHFIQDKMNIEQTPEPLEFTIEPPKGMISWAPVDGLPPLSKIKECQEWLKDYLSSGPKPVQEVIKATEFNERTLFRAKKDLGLIIYKSSKFSSYKYVDFWELAGPENNWGAGPLSIDPPGKV